MTPEQMLANIQIVMAVHAYNLDADEGDKYLSQSGYAMEAIDAILNDNITGIVRMFLEFPIPSTD
jgi:hypothetical protein